MANAKKKRSFWKILLMFLNIIAMISLGLSYLSYHVSPESFWLPSFAGLAYPYVVVANLLFCMVWLFVRKRNALFSLLLVLAGWNHLRANLQLSGTQKVFSGTDKHFSVMSFNVRNFDLYNYGKNWEINYSGRNKIFSFLQSASPDILCFQEFVHDMTGKFKTYDTLSEILPCANVHAEYTVNSRNKVMFGIATYSRFPITGKGRINFDNSRTNLCIFTDMVVYDDTLRVYNAHFESIHLNSEDYALAGDLGTLKTDMDNPEFRKRSEILLSQLKNAFTKRASQVRTVAQHIASSPYPVIVCTDLNDTPVSYAYNVLSGKLRDAFIVSGKGTGKTYEGIAPSFRIDYIFHSRDLKSYNFEVIREQSSDHYPIRCDISIEE